jgi:hypothetical protein
VNIAQGPSRDMPYIPSLSDSFNSVGNVGTRSGQRPQRRNPLNVRIEAIDTSIRGIATEVVREATWDLANQHHSSSPSTIASVVGEVIAEDLSQLTMEAFLSEYHDWDDPFLIIDNPPLVSEEPDVPLQNERTEGSRTRR